MTIWMLLAAHERLETERLWLRPLSYADRFEFYHIIGQKEALPFIFPRPISEMESHLLLVEEFLRQPLGVWGIVHKETGQLLGVVRLENSDIVQKTAELGYFLRKEAWGEGYMTEAVRCVLGSLLSDLGFKTLRIIAHEENQASRRVAEKTGFKLIRQFKGSDRYTHQMKRYVAYEIVAGESGYEQASGDFRLP